MNSFNHAPRLKTPEKARGPIAATAALLAALALAGCTPGETHATPDKTPSVSASADPTETPTQTPETEAPVETGFKGTIDLPTFTGDAWKNAELGTQYANCDAFFDANIENRVPLTLESTGQEIAQSFKDKMVVLQSLAGDTSDPLYFEAANNIATCVSANLITNDGGNDGLEMLQGELQSVNDFADKGMVVNYIEPDQVTRFSDGTFPGQTDANDTYAAFAVEGYMNDGIGNQKGTLAVEYFKWVPDAQDYDFVLRVPANETTPNFGPKPPIEVQQ